MFISTKKKPLVQWIDCLNGTKGAATSLPLTLPIGSHKPLVTVTGSAQKLALEPNRDVYILLNGSPLTSTQVISESSTLQLENTLYVISPNEEEIFKNVKTDLWTLFDSQSGEQLGEFDPKKLMDAATQLGRAPETLATTPQGLDIGFKLNHIASLLSSPTTTSSKTPTPTPLAEEQNKGEHVCPVCWTRFDAGDALSIAVHENLRGDPVLGPDARLRFHPTRFNDQGLALDPMGLACTDIACPHCRRQLPPGYLDMPHQIISVVGAPSAGKSYYLAVLTRILQDRLPEDFGLAFKDGDPSGNILLNQMRNTLFSASTPEDALLGKTALEGATYEKLPRLGRLVSLPRPFIYTLSRPGNKRQETSLILYDNAGEHFEPGIDIHDSPGAMHVASSAGLIFLFDPTANARFKAKLIGVDDPQLSIKGRVDQQDTILAEMEARIKRVLGISQNQRITTPLAFVVGKSDTWQFLLPSPLEPILVDGKIDQAAIDRNSQRVRQVLVSLCPGLVATAESLAEQIRYFAASSFGHQPMMITSGPNTGRIAPNPQKLSPSNVESPVYWLLHQSCPELIPAKS
jgi:hypothetical protein